MSGKYSANNPLSDIIPLEGAFVSTFISDISPIALKVYIMLLYLCNHPEIKVNSIIDIAAKLNCTATDVNDSMEYLSKIHLLNYTSRPFSFEILSAHIASKNTGMYTADALTAYADYFAGIRALFPGRSITNGEYDKARDWVEIYGLSVETALLLVSHCIANKDNSISFSYIDKVAQTWSNNDIITVEKAEEHLALEEAKKHEVSKLLLHLGIKRTPTVDEITLYRRWKNEFGFELKGIKAACQETTKSLNPSLAYINRILENLHSLDLHSEKQIKAYLSESDNEKRLISVILSSLGERSRTITTVHTEAVKILKEAGYDGELLIFIAKTMCENGYHTFTKFIQKVEELINNKITEKEKISEFLKHKPTNSTQKTTNSNFKGRDDSAYNNLFDDISKLEV